MKIKNYGFTREQMRYMRHLNRDVAAHRSIVPSKATRILAVVWHTRIILMERCYYSITRMAKNESIYSPQLSKRHFVRLKNNVAPWTKALASRKQGKICEIWALSRQRIYHSSKTRTIKKSQYRSSHIQAPVGASFSRRSSVKKKNVVL